MKILLLYPKNPDTFWSFKYALKFAFKKASNPPLGLLTVAAMLPKDFEKRLIDMNVTKLRDKDILWADYVFVSAMAVQRGSVAEVLARCKELGARVVAGGPLFTSAHEEFAGLVDHFVLNEAELTLPQFLSDLKAGTPKKIYSSSEWANMTLTPAPEWDLAATKKYASMSIQYSRGCPFNCDFCDITLLFGKMPRTKSTEQVLTELQNIYDRGWRSGVFIVDDNFIGNKRKLKTEVLPAIEKWMREHKNPFTFITQASVELADDEELMTKMVSAGFDTVFVGIETPNEESLVECTKHQNKNRDLVATVKKMQNFGLQVQAGFIVGFDSDPNTIFDRQIKFIQQSGVATAMVGLLNAFKGTRLYQRMEKEGRLLKEMSGDNTDFSMNFIPKMNKDALISGYKRIISTIYSPKNYYARVKNFLREYRPSHIATFRFKFLYLAAMPRMFIKLGVLGRERFQYWKLMGWTFFKKPSALPLAMTLAIYGFHFRKNFEKHLEA